MITALAEPLQLDLFAQPAPVSDDGAVVEWEALTGTSRSDAYDMLVARPCPTAKWIFWDMLIGGTWFRAVGAPDRLTVYSYAEQGMQSCDPLRMTLAHQWEFSPKVTPVEVANLIQAGAPPSWGRS